MSLIAELKRRKVFRAALGYAVFSWLLLQITDVIMPIIHTPEWVTVLIFLVLLAGLPIALILAWLFDLTNLGLYRERPLAEIAPEIAAYRLSSNRKMTECFTSIWVTLMGIGLSFGASVVIYLHQGRQIENDYQRMAEAIATEIEHCIVVESEALKTLGTLFINNQTPSFETFRQVSEDLISNHPELRAGEWVPRVRSEQLDSFTEHMKRYYPGFTVKSFDQDGHEQPIASKNEYFPVSFTIPKAGNEPAIGFDLSSHPDRSSAMQAAARAGTSKRSRSTTLVQSGTPGFLLFHPVYADGLLPVSEQARLETLRGFTLGVVDSNRLIRSALASTPTAAAFQGEIRISERLGDSYIPVISLDLAEGFSLSKLHASADTGNLFGPAWQISIHPTNITVAERYSNEYIVVGLVGLVLSLVLAIIIHLLFSSQSNPTLSLEDQRDKGKKAAMTITNLMPPPESQLDIKQGPRQMARGRKLKG
jgi:CHASE1-domain containing sensor protein